MRASTPDASFSGAPAAVATQHNDNLRSGANLGETKLTPANVNPQQFGKLYSRNTQGRIFAQPLFVPNVVVNGHPHNIVYVATMHNIVYAFDADDRSADAAPLWTAGPEPERMGAAISYKLLSDPKNNRDCRDVGPEVGVTSTPVVDLRTNTLYVVAKADVTGAPDHSGVGFWLHALDLATGADKAPRQRITATAQGTVTGPDGRKVGQTVVFDGLWQLNRPGLLLANGRIFMGFGSTCDYANWRGWILSYDAASLTQVAAFITTPDAKPDNEVNGEFKDDRVPGLAGQGGVWQGAMGLAADAGSVYAMVGNGEVGIKDSSGYDDGSYGRNVGNSFIKLSLADLSLSDWFTPYNAAWMNLRDFDLGSSGPVLLPDDAAQKPLVLGGGKQGVLYVLDRTSMGKLKLGNVMASLKAPWNDDNKPAENRQVVQAFQASEIRASGHYNIHGSPVYWRGADGLMVYLWAEDDHLKAYRFDPSTSHLVGPGGEPGVPFATDAYPQYLQGMPGGILSLSANGAHDGVVWATHLGDHPQAHNMLLEGMLAAFQASPKDGKLVELWNSNMVAARDHTGSPGKFAAPTIADGKVFVASNGYNYDERDFLVEDHSVLQVYGLLSTP